MRYAILSDIHGNLEAFRAVLADISRRRADMIWCLGDIVGYGPDPHACLDLLKRQRQLTVPGNHDLAAMNMIASSDFHPDADESNRWTKEQLVDSDMAFLGTLPPTAEKEGCTLVHASPRDPIWEYMRSAEVAAQNLASFQSQVCLVGHTHKPAVFRCIDNTCVEEKFPDDAPLDLGKTRFILNPGGVGQPRDGDPRASYAIFDGGSRSVQLFRVAYDIAATQAKMLKAKLPQALIARLSYGL